MLSRTTVRYLSTKPPLSTANSLRASNFRVLPRSTSRTGRRYASGTPGAMKRIGNQPWIIVAAAIMIPGAYFVLRNRSAPHSIDRGNGDYEEHVEEQKPDKYGESPAKKKAKGPTSKGVPIGIGVSSEAGDEQTAKQEAVSNTDTKHSSDVTENPEKSKKGEGTLESAKTKGTVKPDRPQV